MLVTPLPIVTLLRLVHRLNTSFPMRMTLSGIVTLLNLSQEENAKSAMLVTPSGIP